MVHIALHSKRRRVRGCILLIRASLRPGGGLQRHLLLQHRLLEHGIAVMFSEMRLCFSHVQLSCLFRWKRGARSKALLLRLLLLLALALQLLLFADHDLQEAEFCLVGVVGHGRGRGWLRHLVVGFPWRRLLHRKHVRGQIRVAVLLHPPVLRIELHHSERTLCSALSISAVAGLQRHLEPSPVAFATCQGRRAGGIGGMVDMPKLSVQAVKRKKGRSGNAPDCPEKVGVCTEGLLTEGRSGSGPARQKRWRSGLQSQQVCYRF